MPTEIYKRHLPHIQNENAVLYMTVCLKGSLPKEKIEQLKDVRDGEIQRLKKLDFNEEELKIALQKNQKLYLGRFDDLLDNEISGEHWLKDKRIAAIWWNALKHFDGKRYKLICSTIMSNHVHFIFYKLDRKLSQIMKSLKGYSAREINKILRQENSNIKNEFWQDESFDRYIRDRVDLRQKIFYILNNPVKAGIVDNWEDYEWNYLHEDFRKFL